MLSFKPNFAINSSTMPVPDPGVLPPSAGTVNYKPGGTGLATLDAKHVSGDNYILRLKFPDRYIPQSYLLYVKLDASPATLANLTSVASTSDYISMSKSGSGVYEAVLNRTPVAARKLKIEMNAFVVDRVLPSPLTPPLPAIAPALINPTGAQALADYNCYIEMNTTDGKNLLVAIYSVVAYRTAPTSSALYSNLNVYLDDGSTYNRVQSISEILTTTAFNAPSAGSVRRGYNVIHAYAEPGSDLLAVTVRIATTDTIWTEQYRNLLLKWNGTGLAVFVAANALSGSVEHSTQIPVIGDKTFVISVSSFQYGSGSNTLNVYELIDNTKILRSSRTTANSSMWLYNENHDNRIMVYLPTLQKIVYINTSTQLTVMDFNPDTGAMVLSKTIQPDDVYLGMNVFISLIPVAGNSKIIISHRLRTTNEFAITVVDETYFQ